MAADNYDTRKDELTRQINAQKSIYKFRTFLYSLNKDIRQRAFDISREYLQNELQNISLNISERERVIQLLNHFQWNEFEQRATNWWTVLSFNHASCISLFILINLWTDDISISEENISDNSSLGLR